MTRRRNHWTPLRLVVVLLSSFLLVTGTVAVVLSLATSSTALPSPYVTAPILWLLLIVVLATSRRR